MILPIHLNLIFHNNFSDSMAFNSVTELCSKHIFYSPEYIIKNTYL